jgi:hypothetical protein
MLGPPGPGLPRRAPTPADLLLLSGLLAIALLLPFRPQTAETASSLWVHSAGGSFRVDPAVDRDLSLQGPAGETRLSIRDGQVWIAQAPCRRQICQHMGSLQGGRGSLVCIPNQVVLRFTTATGPVDGVTR